MKEMMTQKIVAQTCHTQVELQSSAVHTQVHFEAVVVYTQEAVVVYTQEAVFVYTQEAVYFPCTQVDYTEESGTQRALAVA